MDNERLNTILKLVAGLGSAGVSAISPAAGRAVLGGANTWSNIEEDQRRRKEAERHLAMQDKEMTMREAEHEQGKRLNDVSIAQKTSEIEATENARKFADELAASSKQRLASVRRPADNVGPLTERDQGVASEGADADAQIAALRGGGWSGYGNVLMEQQKQRSAMTEAEKDRAAALERTSVGAKLYGASRENVADINAEAKKGAPRPGDITESDLIVAEGDVRAFDDDPIVTEALGKAKTPEDRRKRLVALLADPEIRKLYNRAGAARRLLERRGGGGPSPAGNAPDKVQNTMAQIEALTGVKK